MRAPGARGFLRRRGPGPVGAASVSMDSAAQSCSREGKGLLVFLHCQHLKDLGSCCRLEMSSLFSYNIYIFFLERENELKVYRPPPAVRYIVSVYAIFLAVVSEQHVKIIFGKIFFKPSGF